MPAPAGEATVVDDIGFDRRDLDLVVFADQFPLGVGRESSATLLANARHMVAEFVGIVGQPPIVRLMPELRPAGSRILALFLLVYGRPLRRGARILIGPLEPHHQLDQLLFAQVLKSPRSIAPWIQRSTPVARGWAITVVLPEVLL
jgi:hypothetical protein